jgi:magnesium chelatase subunit I
MPRSTAIRRLSGPPSDSPIAPPESYDENKAVIYFPFTALVAQEELKLALQIAAVEPTIGGVLVFGDRGTGKSTAVRALAALLPPMSVVSGCP